jgi:hypothetical protein
VPGRLAPRRAILAGTLVAALVAGACSAATTPSQALTSSSTAPSEVPTLETTLPDDLCAGTGVDCVLQPGVYLAQAFQPPIGFSLADDGWVNGAYVERAIQLERGPGDDPTESVSIVSGQLDGPKAEGAAAGATAAAFLTYLPTVKGITLGAKTAVLVGGLPASQLDVKVASANVTLFQTPVASGVDDTFDLRAGETARLIVEDVGTARVVFIIETFGTTKLATFFTAEIQPFLASVTFPTP